MNSIEEIRSTISTTLKTLHDASYPAVPLVWPNFFMVDLENLSGPYVSVELSWASPVEIFGCGNTETLTRGELLVSYVRKIGDGLTGAAAYSDVLLQNLCFKKLSGVTYFGLRVLSTSPHPGLIGRLNVIPFLV